MRIAVAQLNFTIGDLDGNQQLLREALSEARRLGAEIFVSSELAITGYPPRDFVLHESFLKESEAKTLELAMATKGLLAFIGTPRSDHGEKRALNSTAIFADGELLGYQDKILLPTYDVFDETRYFSPGGSPGVIAWKGLRVVPTICEDLWARSSHVEGTRYARDPVQEIEALAPDLVVNLSASPFEMGKFPVRYRTVGEGAKRLRCPIAYCNQVGAHDGLIFDGRSMLVSSEGLLGIAPPFQSAVSVWELESPPIPLPVIDPMEELHGALVIGIQDFLHKQGCARALIGVSGGVDSALVLALAIDALGTEYVDAVFLPSEVTSQLSRDCVFQLIERNPCSLREYPIQGPLHSMQHLLGPIATGLTLENLQARIRGVILMALSNQERSFLLMTGNKSELAMGYSTLYGDQTGALAVLSDVTKANVYRLSRWMNRHQIRIPQQILDRPPTAELRPNQLDRDSLPPYEQIDQIVEDYVEQGLAPEQIALRHHWNISLVWDVIQRLHRAEFKRRQAPPGLKVTSKAFGIGRHFPMVQKYVR